MLNLIKGIVKKIENAQVLTPEEADLLDVYRSNTADGELVDVLFFPKGRIPMPPKVRRVK